MYTVLVCGSASGVYLPPLIVYRSQHLYGSSCENGPDDIRYSATPSGWMSGKIFENWFRTTCVSFVTELKKYVILLFDGHGSHLTFEIIRFAVDNYLIIINIHPSTGYTLQPLDVGVFKPLENRWRKMLEL